LLFLLVLQVMLVLGPAVVLWLKRHSACLVTSCVSLSFLVDGVMIASYCYPWWSWWSYTLWVTLSMLWLHSFLFWCGQNSHNVHLQVVFVEFSLQSHGYVHSSTYLLDSLGLPVASHIGNCCIKMSRVPQSADTKKECFPLRSTLPLQILWNYPLSAVFLPMPQAAVLIYS
jgi:hypothetical protein